MAICTTKELLKKQLKLMDPDKKIENVYIKKKQEAQKH